MAASSSSGAGAEVAIGDKASVNHHPFRFPIESLEKRFPFIDPSSPLGLRNGLGSTTTKPTTKPFALSV